MNRNKRISKIFLGVIALGLVLTLAPAAHADETFIESGGRRHL